MKRTVKAWGFTYRNRLCPWPDGFYHSPAVTLTTDWKEGRIVVAKERNFDGEVRWPDDKDIRKVRVTLTFDDGRPAPRKAKRRARK